jgi:hypothetical protein
MVTAAPAVMPATPKLAAPLPGPFGLRVGVAAGEPFAGCGDGVALAPAGALQSRTTLWLGNSAMPAVHVLSRNSWGDDAPVQSVAAKKVALPPVPA